MTQINENASQSNIISTGSIQTDNLSMGDFHQYNYTNKSKLTEVSYNNSDKQYLPPNYMENLLQLALEKRIVFIAGDNIFGQNDLARYLAFQIKAKEEFQDKEIVELFDKNENQEERKSLFDLLYNEKCHQKIVLLTNLHPEKIDYNFDRLLDYSIDESCLFIISMDYGLEIWKKAGKLVVDYWFEIPEGRHYSEIQLQSYFLQRFHKERPKFWLLSMEATNQDSLLSETWSVESTINRFGNIDQVNLFLNYYVGLSEFPDDRKLLELVEALCQGNSKMVRSWFYQLNHRNKMVVLGATMFDGMLVDQFFEALNDINIQTFWETSDPTLKALDYFQLSFLDPFFQIQLRNEEQYIFCKTPQVKSVLLDLGRVEYRRHFKAAMDVFYRLMRNSYLRQSINWELYGTSSRRVLIRKSFGDILHDAGAVEFNLVESHLLELAASGNLHLQNICAKSIAQWRLSGKEEQFFETLKKWQEDNDIQDRIKDLFERSIKDSSTDAKNAIDLIKTTAVLALGHASYYDQPNKLHEEIVQGMVHFAKEPYSGVHNSICQALPKFIHHHSLQLQHVLFQELMPIGALREPIVEGLVLAMESYPEQVSEAINKWFDWCMKDASKDNRRYSPTQRDNVLIAILDVLGEANLTENKYFEIERLYTNFLIPLIQQEMRGEVIQHVLNFLVKVQSLDFNLALRFLNQTIGKLNKTQRLFVVMGWGMIYRKQRLESTKTTYEIDFITYPVWDEGQQLRPLTTVEKTLYSWMDGESTERRFATLTFLELTKSHDRYEREAYILLKREQDLYRFQQQSPAPSATRPMPSLSAEVGLHLSLRIRIFFYFLFSSNTNKFLLKDTILLFLNVNRYTSDDLMSLIQRWKNSSQQGVTSRLAKWLTRFF
ncbi:hypothetical protein [Fluviicola taffensis]|uniref:hypothetical protein n=1 Tax=Fluviicola taffensis TaxID=191579 RepID=UPI003137DF36